MAQRVQLFVLKRAGGSSSVVPLEINCDGQIVFGAS